MYIKKDLSGIQEGESFVVLQDKKLSLSGTVLRLDAMCIGVTRISIVLIWENPAVRLHVS